MLTVENRVALIIEMQVRVHLAQQNSGLDHDYGLE